MLVVPGEDAVQAIEQVLFFVKAMRFSRVDDKFGFDAVALQAAVEFLALAEGIGRIGVPLEN